jgi:protein ImuB
MRQASLWLAAHLPRLPLEALAEAPAARAVIHSRGSRRWIVAADDAALAPGLDWLVARARRPETLAVERRAAREIQALESLACAAYGFGDRISWRIDEPQRDHAVPRFTLWLEIGASLKLFGGLERLLAGIERKFSTLGYAACFGVAPTLEAAAAFAREGCRPVTEPGDLHPALAQLPLPALALPDEALQLLLDMGLHRTGELLELPREALNPRLGSAALAALDRLTGARPDTRRWYRPPARFARRMDFLDEIESAEGLGFPLQRLLGELAHYLRARATGVQQFRLELGHGGEQAPTIIELMLSAPSRDENLLLRVAREKLAAARMPAPARGMSLLAERFAAPPGWQRDLFDTQARQDEEATAVIDRLVARLGEQAVWRPQLLEDHRPERACRMAGAHEKPKQSAVPAAARPAFLLRQARPLPRPPPILGGVERVESGWWDGGDARRDYFACELERGARGWAYLDRGDGQIYLHGLWA